MVYREGRLLLGMFKATLYSTKFMVTTGLSYSNRDIDATLIASYSPPPTWHFTKHFYFRSIKDSYSDQDSPHRVSRVMMDLNTIALKHAYSLPF